MTAGRSLRGGLIALAMAAACGSAAAQQPATKNAGAAKAATPPASQGQNQQVLLDRVVAIVNGDLILESDLDAERRFAAFQPFSEPKTMTQDEIINRLIDRALILQQMELQEQQPITDAEVDAELNSLRKTIPKCATYHCETDAGWQRFVADQGFTIPELKARWKQRMEVLQFIEERFRMGIRISQDEIDDYYKTTLLPQYEKEHAQAPPEATIANKIQEILLQQQVGKLLDDWLTSLRAQGSVRILKPGEEAP
jgi:peptidyl-prolyl cis-trans isomerase SurA